ncbi:hypothetical protein DNFV4_00984 [Nitrospira tepida]|uniref:SGNH hydrolase-type esterase domain-containing protein n=1 Tax=Nitrospira tepida TaxID=2973512 RepID=A0AA86MX27_9BACT|nr:SGNH/GDSL hydrolase family protein [Nitrospira tepida]CAI4030556.1 hypothetical protein DNFV4_00984 [Nitrospira tepida]
MGSRENKASIGRWSGEWVITAGLYLIEVFVVILVMSLYRAEGKSSLFLFLVSRPGLVSLMLAFVIGALIILVIRQCRHAARAGSRKWILAIAMNVVVVVTVLLVSEVSLRILAVPNNLGENLGGKLLYPKQWARFKETYSALLQKAKTQPTFEVFDEILGFTVGPNRRSEDGLYFSSMEGLRSARVGESFQGGANCRIALVGDSYTFGEIVRYEDTWAYLMQRRLGSSCQVLNFGVGGYGVDQMYLRYLKDVHAWHPDLVILAFINHDVTRTMAIYSFLTFPDGGMPFAKPRFVLQNGELEVLNRPLPNLRQMLAKSSIRDLPFIEYDVSYRETEWDRPNWRYFYHSYLFRLLISLYPLHEPERPQVTDRESARINRKIFEEFVKVVTKDGAVPVIVYLPTEEEVPVPWWEPIGLKILREAGLPHHDLRKCVEEAHVSELFNPAEIGGHYSPRGNQVINDCLFQKVQPLSALKSSRQ